MPLRNVEINQAGLLGMQPDIPSYKLPLQATTLARDAIAQRSMLSERNGWAYLPVPSTKTPPTSPDPGTLDWITVARARYVLADRRMLSMWDAQNRGMFAWEADQQFLLNTATGKFKYQGMYRDLSMWCADDGETPMVFYSGATSDQPIHEYGIAVTGFLAGEAVARIPGEDLPVGVGSPASFLECWVTQAGGYTPPGMNMRILEKPDARTVALEGIKNSLAQSTRISRYQLTMVSYPCCQVYSAGTVNSDGAGTLSFVGGIVDGSSDWGRVTIENGDSILIQQGDLNWVMNGMDAVTSKTTITSGFPATGNGRFAIHRRAPFKSACVFKNSLMGTGVKQFPATVYAGAPNWNPTHPPGWPYNTPFSLTDVPMYKNTDPGVFEMYPIQVPDVYGDANIAIITNGDQVFVCKRRSIHSIYGIYGDFQQRLIEDGIGCLHRGGAVSTFSGVWIAGDEGLHTWDGSTFKNVMNQKVATLWHTFTRSFDFDGGTDFISLGERDYHLFLTITANSRRDKLTLVYDIRRDIWTSEVSNLHPIHYFSGIAGGENVECLAVSPWEPSRVIDAGRMVAETAERLADGNGQGPRFMFDSTFRLSEQIEGETILGDLAVHCNLGSDLRGSNEVNVTVSSSGGVRLEQGRAVTAKALKPITSTEKHLIDRWERTVNRRGRLHRVRIERPVPPTDHSVMELAQIDLNVVDSGDFGG